MIILGIDPGFAKIGYGIVKKNGKISYRTCGLIETKNGVIAERILIIENEIEKIIKKEKPKMAGVEKLFFSKNKKTAIAVSEARGAILGILARYNIQIVELSPFEVKIGVTGTGTASKQAVSLMISKILNIKTEGVIDDATDALAVAITAAYTKIF